MGWIPVFMIAAERAKVHGVDMEIMPLKSEEFWSLVIVVFAFAFALSEGIAFFERRVEYYAGNR